MNNIKHKSGILRTNNIKTGGGSIGDFSIPAFAPSFWDKKLSHKDSCPPDVKASINKAMSSGTVFCKGAMKGGCEFTTDKDGTKRCYAMAGRYLWSSVQTRLWRNWELSQQPHFVETILDQLHNHKPYGAIRIHNSGDFSDPQYIKDWISIISQSPDIPFWAYTKSWRIPSLVPLLGELNDLLNIQLFASIVDKSRPTIPLRLSLTLPIGIPLEQLQAECPWDTDRTQTCEVCKTCFTPQPDTPDIVFRPV